MFFSPPIPLPLRIRRLLGDVLSRATWNQLAGRVSTDKRACIDWSGHLPGGWQSGSYRRTRTSASWTCIDFPKTSATAKIFSYFFPSGCSLYISGEFSPNVPPGSLVDLIQPGDPPSVV